MNVYDVYKKKGALFHEEITNKTLKIKAIIF